MRPVTAARVARVLKAAERCGFIQGRSVQPDWTEARREVHPPPHSLSVAPPCCVSSLPFAGCAFTSDGDGSGSGVRVGSDASSQVGSRLPKAS